jgi:hypothetical protein
MRIRALLSTSLVLVVLLLAACSRGFSDDDIESLKKDIKAHYEKEEPLGLIGFKVVDVAFVRANDYELTGYAKMQPAEKGQVVTRPAAKGQVMTLQVQLDCTAHMDRQNRSVIWQCQPSGGITPVPTTKNSSTQ